METKEKHFDMRRSEAGKAAAGACSRKRGTSTEIQPVPSE